ncbi:E3 ubiquitin-protein ligase TRIM39 isoform X3 [Alosa sapidissima]|uniref:E3 ubiquitin-protein ligase TRIM39 isoform X3 n=1 Tax=Alosa sapidissima TaxID=34773 RepID=UPI001C0A214B|nr:E3 ubiquitin-protein ligase TRIM39 isoform X3 [Alosa sapidissima]
MPFPRSFLSEEQFQCSICLDVFDNPVSTPCGHSFCMTCIGRYWEGAKLCQCPLCKESFRKKPPLHINRTLREITEQFKRMSGGEGACGGQGKEACSRGEERLTKREEIPGDLITQVRIKIPKNSHRENAPGTVAVMPPPPENSQDATDPSSFTRRVSYRRYTFSGAADAKRVALCAKHQQQLDMFCRTDQQCICVECAEHGHESHSVVSAESHWHESKSQISIREHEIQEMISERLRKVEEIKSSLVDIKMSAERETQGSVRVFSTLMASIERSQAELLEVIEMNRCSAEHQAEGMIRELEQEVLELKKRSSTLGNLLHADDYVKCLKSYYSAVSSPPPIKDWSEVSVTSDLGTRRVYQSVCQLLERFQEELQRLPEVGIQNHMESSLMKFHPKQKRIQDYAADITLDPNTAHPRLILSEDRKRVKCGDRHQPLPDNPERFDRVVCVLGREGFDSGRHYWEVEVGGKTDWDVGVARRSVNRKGKITVNPSNGYWFLSLRDKSNYAFRTEPSTSLSVSLRPQKVGVFVDYEKGQVSFYNVEAKVHIYTFQDTFSETIHPFFSPCTNKSGKNEAPLIVTPVPLD